VFPAGTAHLTSSHSSTYHSPPLICTNQPHLWAHTPPPHGAGQLSANMETLKAPHIFIELTLSEKLLAVLGGVCTGLSTQLNHSSIYSKHSDTDVGMG